eukprot:365595-Chlamydomonas_euryale.AAC.2
MPRPTPLPACPLQGTAARRPPPSKTLRWRAGGTPRLRRRPMPAARPPALSRADGTRATPMTREFLGTRSPTERPQQLRQRGFAHGYRVHADGAFATAAAGKGCTWI